MCVVTTRAFRGGRYQEYRRKKKDFITNIVAIVLVLPSLEFCEQINVERIIRLQYLRTYSMVCSSNAGKIRIMKNINKIAFQRTAHGHSVADLLSFATACDEFFCNSLAQPYLRVRKQDASVKSHLN